MSRITEIERRLREIDQEIVQLRLKGPQYRMTDGGVGLHEFHDDTITKQQISQLLKETEKLERELAEEKKKQAKTDQ